MIEQKTRDKNFSIYTKKDKKQPLSLWRTVRGEIWSGTVILRKEGAGLGSATTPEPLVGSGTFSSAGELQQEFIQQCCRCKSPHLDIILRVINKIKIGNPNLPTWSSWSRVLMSTGGEHGRGTSVRGTPFDRTDPPNSDSGSITFNSGKISFQLLTTFQSDV